MPQWRVYYDGGATHDGDVMAAPGLGALLIVEQCPEHGRRIVAGLDYFVWDRGRWWARDLFGMMDYLVTPRPEYKILVGRMVPNDYWNEVWRKADADPDFPARTGFGAHERKVYNLTP